LLSPRGSRILRGKNAFSTPLLASLAVGLVPLQPAHRPRRLAPAGDSRPLPARPPAATGVAHPRRPPLPDARPLREAPARLRRQPRSHRPAVAHHARRPHRPRQEHPAEGAGVLPREGRPLPDLRMLAHFDPVKRHWLLFDALRKLPASFRVLLVGVPLGGRTEKDLLDEARTFGVQDRFELLLRPSRDEVLAALARSRASLIF